MLNIKIFNYLSNRLSVIMIIYSYEPHINKCGHNSKEERMKYSRGMALSVVLGGLISVSCFAEESAIVKSNICARLLKDKSKYEAQLITDDKFIEANCSDIIAAADVVRN